LALPLSDPADLLQKVSVVLVRTTHPGNIGATARAMKTMGLARLVLVEPRYFPDAQATAMASGADDVLAAARVCASLDEALKDTRFAVAMTARVRELAYEPVNIRVAAAQVLAEAGASEVALVFGTEMSGLSNDEVLKCQLAAMIPAVKGYSSLNLAAAVQLMAYELRMSLLGGVVGMPPVQEPAQIGDIERFYEHLQRNLIDSGFLDPAFPKKLMERLRRLFGRARLEKEEVNILRGILTEWDKRMAERPLGKRADKVD
jgi:tRNA/rRNA methyltransferase